MMGDDYRPVRRKARMLLDAAGKDQRMVKEGQLRPGLAARGQACDAIQIRQNVTAQRKQLDAQDVLLTPDPGSLAVTDFQNAKQAIAAGAAAATAALPKLKLFALTPEQYAA